jgi:hypothetical protein
LTEVYETMPTNVEVIEACEFIRATPAGILDLEASRKLLSEMAQASTGLSDLHVLLDTRRAMTLLTTSDLWTLAQQVASAAQNRVRRTAVVCSDERFDHARFFVMCAEQHSLNMRAFVDYERAMDWLLHGDRQ